MQFAKILVLVACCCALMGSLVLAAVEGGDVQRGRTLAVEKCKHCHIQGAEAGTMTPISKTQRQWERFFDKHRHDKIAPGSWDGLTDKDLKDILQFLHDHAADSDQPATLD